jgi:hypothetical protein
VKVVAGLSKLEKHILAEGLWASLWRAPIHRAWAGPMAPGSFDSTPILIEFYSLTKAETKTVGLPKLLAARAAISRSSRSLIKRGLLEPGNARGWWLLSRLGKQVAQSLCPLLAGPTIAELTPKITQAFMARSRNGELPPGMDLETFTRRCFQPGVEVDLDFSVVHTPPAVSK